MSGYIWHREVARGIGPVFDCLLQFQIGTEFLAEPDGSKVSNPGIDLASRFVLRAPRTQPVVLGSGDVALVRGRVDAFVDLREEFRQHHLDVLHDLMADGFRAERRGRGKLVHST